MAKAIDDPIMKSFVKADTFRHLSYTSNVAPFTILDDIPLHFIELSLLNNELLQKNIPLPAQIPPFPKK